MTGVLIGIGVALAVTAVRAVALPAVRVMIFAWVWLYTLRLPVEDRDGRRAEIRSHVWEQAMDGQQAGYTPDLIAVQMVVQLLKGLPADLSWRFAARRSPAGVLDGVVASRPPTLASHGNRLIGFVDFHEANFRFVFAYIYARIPDMDRTADLTSECFERVFVKGLHKIPEWRAVLFSVARTRIQEAVRDGEVVPSARRRPDVTLWESNPTKAARMEVFLTALRRLPLQAQEIVSLKFDAELTNAEIAHVLGLTEATVRARLFRSLQVLRREMGAQRSGSSRPGEDGDEEGGSSLVPAG